MIFRSVDLSVGVVDIGIPFSENIFDNIKDATTRILDRSNEMDYMAVMTHNYEVLFNTQSQIAPNGRLDFVHINSCFSNFLNSCYTWKCYHKHYCHSIFENLLAKYRTKYTAYRLCEELRNYTTHKAMAITKHIYDVLSETHDFPIDPQAILELDTKKHKLNLQLKKQLEEMVIQKQKIDAFKVINDYYQLCIEIQRELWESYIPQVHKDLSTISSILPLSATNIYNIGIASDDQSIHLHTGQIVAQFLDKATRLYPEFVPDTYVGKF